MQLLCVHMLYSNSDEMRVYINGLPLYPWSRQSACNTVIQQGASLNTILLCQWLTMRSLLVLSLAIFLCVDAVHGQEQDHLSRIQARQLNNGDLNCMRGLYQEYISLLCTLGDICMLYNIVVYYIGKPICIYITLFLVWPPIYYILWANTVCMDTYYIYNIMGPLYTGLQCYILYNIYNNNII